MGRLGSEWTVSPFRSEKCAMCSVRFQPQDVTQESARSAQGSKPIGGQKPV